MLAAVLKAKYYPDSSFWTAKNSGPRSVFWSSILQVKQQLHDNVILQLHAGNSSVWSSPWCPIWDSIHSHMKSPVTVNPLPSKVSDL
jgi:hypothetical protein